MLLKEESKEKKRDTGRIAYVDELGEFHGSLCVLRAGTHQRERFQAIIMTFQPFSTVFPLASLAFFAVFGAMDNCSRWTVM